MAQKQIEGYLTKRDRILRYLLLNCTSSEEGCTLKEIASAVMLSPTGARHYLNILENEGLVFHSEMQGKAGRPAMAYFLTGNGLNKFPKAYVEFSISLMEEIKERYGEKTINELLDAVGRKSAARIKTKLNKVIGLKKSNKSLKTALKEIVKIFEENGKFPELSEDEVSYTLKNYNCLFYDIVKQEPLVCRVTETIMAELTNEMAVKVKCIKDGDGVCLFKIDKNSVL
ncbi:MAG: helix-turn-helix transcriptional regulator [Candidatus Hodarchaeales archaeon]